MLWIRKKKEIRSGAGGRRRNRVGKVVKSGRSKDREQRKARGKRDGGRSRKV